MAPSPTLCGWSFLCRGQRPPQDGHRYWGGGLEGYHQVFQLFSVPVSVCYLASQGIGINRKKVCTKITDEGSSQFFFSSMPYWRLQETLNLQEPKLFFSSQRSLCQRREEVHDRTAIGSLAHQTLHVLCSNLSSSPRTPPFHLLSKAPRLKMTPLR